MTAHPLLERARELAREVLDRRVVDRIWERDPSVWTSGAAGDAQAPIHAAIGNRLGWLTAPRELRAQVDSIQRFVATVRRDQLSSAYLLGMGGSSLCAEVLRAVRPRDDHELDLHVLDTTDEAAVQLVTEALEPDRTLFIVSSKSGGTIEVDALERHFHELMVRRLGSAAAGSHFIAITDPQTALERLAAERRYRHTFVNPPDIGGRFSVLSLFGLVPAALLGLDVEDLLNSAIAMGEGCRQHNLANPGLDLGTYLGAGALAGRDKLTVVLPPDLASLGLWIEQLIAESTGKHGTGVLPVVDERVGTPDLYGPDRLFVSLETEREHVDREALNALEAHGQPVLRLSIRESAIGAEFFRWEFATAILGRCLGINPFDEPNVQEAKDRTSELLVGFARHQGLSEEPPATSSRGLAVHGALAEGAAGPAEAIEIALGLLHPPQYAAFLSYLPADAGARDTLQAVREMVRARFGVATTLGTGPRYLHSTGQYHKGGPNTGLYFVLTAADRTATPVPGRPYTFMALKHAQALGDFRALVAHDRRVLRLHLDRDRDASTVLRDAFRIQLRAV
jgi:transaldolase / glucose-6-phosphate isomerase